MRVGTVVAFISLFLVGFCGVCVWVRAAGLVVGVYGYGFRPSPAFLGRGLRSVSGYGFGRNLTCLGWVCGMCVWVWVSAVPCHSWLGFVACGLVWVSPEVRLSWLGYRRLWWGGLVPFLGGLLWVLFSAFLGCGLA